MRIERAGRWPKVPLWAAAIVAVYAVLVGLKLWLGDDDVVLCTFRRLTGLPCPGCGSTRMVHALAQGHPGQAAAHNPLMFAVGVGTAALLILRVAFRRRIVWITSSRSRRILTVVLVLAVLANWAYLLAVW